MLIGISVVASASETNYKCVITQDINVVSGVGRKLTSDEMKKAIYGFEYNEDTRVIVDAVGDIWTYAFTQSDIDYFENKTSKVMFLIGKKDGKYLNAGIFNNTKKTILKSICKEQ